jgi:hypothetical protein
MILIFAAIGCGGYKAEVDPRSPEEMQIEDLAHEMEKQADDLSIQSEDAEMKEFAERTASFHNACHRFGANSLEARKAFDKLYFQFGRIDANIAGSPHETEWSKIRTDYLLKIASMLGYRPDTTE